MSDLHGPLDREARRVAAQPGALDAVRKRADRNRRVRRVVTGAVALMIGGAGMAIAFAAFRTETTSRPSAGPSSATPAPSPSNVDATPSSFTLEVLNATGQGLDAMAPYIFLLFQDAEAVGSASFKVFSDTEERRSTSQILTDFAHEDAAVRIEQTLLPGAQIGRLPPDSQMDIRVVLGRDFANRELDGIHAYQFVREFMAVRHTGGGAERFLTERAARQYRTHEGGLSLYGYDQGTHDITEIRRLPQLLAVFVVVVRIPQWPDPEPGDRKMSVYETLHVGRAADPEGGPTDLFILYAERNS